MQAGPQDHANKSLLQFMSQNSKTSTRSIVHVFQPACDSESLHIASNKTLDWTQLGIVNGLTMAQAVAFTVHASQQQQGCETNLLHAIRVSEVEFAARLDPGVVISYAQEKLAHPSVALRSCASAASCISTHTGRSPW